MLQLGRRGVGTARVGAELSFRFRPAHGAKAVIHPCHPRTSGKVGAPIKFSAPSVSPCLPPGGHAAQVQKDPLRNKSANATTLVHTV